MFTENIFEGACSNSMGEVILIMVGTFLLGILLGYLIWGWVKKRLIDLEEKIIELNRKLTESNAEVSRLTKENFHLSEQAAIFKREGDLKSSQYSSAISRIRKLESEVDHMSDVPPDDDVKVKEMSAKYAAQTANLQALEKALATQKTALIEKEKALLAAEKALADSKNASISKVSANPAVVKLASEETKPRETKSTPASKFVAASLDTDKEPKSRRRGRPKKLKTDEAKATTEKKKRGRPKKVKTDEAVVPKRRVGRPKKVVEGAESAASKKRRGRPKKEAVKEVKSEKTTVKKGRGLPKKITSESIVLPLKPKKRGRPKKSTTEPVVQLTPKKQARPKKLKTEDAASPKRSVGRPKKVKTEEATAPKRSVGRPKKTKSVASTKVAKKSTGKRGRPKGSKNAQKKDINAELLKASAVFGKKIKENDLKLIEGVGPKIAKLFQANGIDTWKKLATSSQKKLKTTIEKIGPRHHIHDPATWPRQAQMAEKGEWKKLKVYQDSLDRGRKPE